MKYVGENSLKKLLNLIKEKLSTKVDKVEGKDLSTNDYTNDEKTKLSGIEAEANKYTLPVAGEALGGVKSGTDITVDASGNVSVNDDSHSHVISNVDGLQTALDGKSATTHTHKYAGSDSAGGPANAVKNGVVTRAKLANDALYSPTATFNSDRAIALTDLGKTLWPQGSSAGATYTLSLTANVSSALPVGFEVAIVYIITSCKVRLSVSGVRMVHAGDGQVANPNDTTTFTIPEIGNMIALKKIDNGGSVGDLWLVTGNVEVV